MERAPPRLLEPNRRGHSTPGTCTTASKLDQVPLPARRGLDRAWFRAETGQSRSRSAAATSLVQSRGANMSMTLPVAFRRPSSVHAATLHSRALIFEKDFSIGLTSGPGSGRTGGTAPAADTRLTYVKPLDCGAVSSPPIDGIQNTGAKIDSTNFGQSALPHSPVRMMKQKSAPKGLPPRSTLTPSLEHETKQDGALERVEIIVGNGPERGNARRLLDQRKPLDVVDPAL